MTADLPQIRAAARLNVLDVQRIRVPDCSRHFAVQGIAWNLATGRAAVHGGDAKARTLRSWTNSTSQAPAPVSVRDKEDLIHAPSSRIPSTSSPDNVTIWPGRRWDNCRAIRGLSGMTCVLALWEMMTSLETGVPGGDRQK